MFQNLSHKRKATAEVEDWWKLGYAECVGKHGNKRRKKRSKKWRRFIRMGPAVKAVTGIEEATSAQDRYHTTNFGGI
jgi:hypothetical protein